MPYGNWSGVHAPTDINTPITVTYVGDTFQKNSYLFGIMVNSGGQRFFDEGADFRMYTYCEVRARRHEAAATARVAGVEAKRCICFATNTA